MGLWERQHCILKCLFQPQNGRSKTQCSDETCNFEVKKKLDPVCRFCCFVLEEKDRKLVLPLVPWNYPLCEDGAGGEGCVCVGGGGGWPGVDWHNSNVGRQSQQIFDAWVLVGMEPSTPKSRHGRHGHVRSS